MKNRKLYPSIDDLVKTKELSFRAGTCCKKVSLKTLHDILKFYMRGHFRYLRGMGTKTRLEIQWLCETLISPIPNCTFPNPEEEILHDSDAEMIKRFQELLLNGFNKETVEDKYNRIVQECSPCIRTWLDKIPFYTFMTEYLTRLENKPATGFSTYSEDKSPAVRHFFIKNLREAIEIKEKLKTEINRQFCMSKEDYLKDEIIDNYGLTGSVEFPVSYHLEHGHFPMFWIFEKQLENDDSRDMNALKKTFEVYRNQNVLSLLEFADEYSISRERVRQIRKHIFRNVFRRRSRFLRERTDWDLYKPWNKDAIWQADMQYYIDDEQCNFSEKFVLHIMQNRLYYTKYTLFGSINPTLKKNGWTNTFLVKDDYVRMFDFDEFRETFNELRLNNKSEYLLDVQKYVEDCKCWTKYFPYALEPVTDIVKDILRYEFNMYPEADGRVRVPAFKKKTMSDIMYGILKDNGNPMHLHDIFAEFKRINPNHRYTEPIQLRPCLLKHEGISYRNRRSIYVLKEWQHVKFGTIRGCIMEFLSKKKSPQPIKDITDYVLQYFPESNVSSIRTSMFNDTQQRFGFFNYELFGLSNKNYHSKYEKTENSPMPFTLRLSRVEKFIAKHKHFPFVSSKDRDEKILGVWWMRIRKGVYAITEEQQKEVERVEKQYADCEVSKRIYLWNMNYGKLKSFTLENRKLPSIYTDKFLYHWMVRMKADFLGNKLNGNQRQKYLELLELKDVDLHKLLSRTEN